MSLIVNFMVRGVGGLGCSWVVPQVRAGGQTCGQLGGRPRARPPGVFARRRIPWRGSRCPAGVRQEGRHGRLAAMSVGTLVLLRHGESTWNAENLFTGWVDVPLSEKGEREARRG